MTGALWVIAVSAMLLAASVAVYVWHRTRRVVDFALVPDDEIDAYLDDGWVISLDVDAIIVLEDGYLLPMVKYVD